MYVGQRAILAQVRDREHRLAEGAMPSAPAFALPAELTAREPLALPAREPLVLPAREPAALPPASDMRLCRRVGGENR